MKSYFYLALIAVILLLTIVSLDGVFDQVQNVIFAFGPTAPPPAGSGVITVTTSGLVGIGTASPSNSLEVRGTSGNTGISIDESSSGASQGPVLDFREGGAIRTQFFYNNNTNIFDINVNEPGSQLQFRTGGTERMRIDASGNVGIGAISPDNLLHVEGSAGNTGITIEESSVGPSQGPILDFKELGSLRAQFFYNNNTNFLSIIAVEPGSQLTLGSSGIERLRINNIGNVGIGTGLPGAKLDVRGNIKFGTSGDLFALGGRDESLRIIRGTVDHNGNLLAGSGFSPTRTSTGIYAITFDQAFPSPPTVIVSRFQTLDIKRHVIVTSVTAAGVFVSGVNGDGFARDVGFSLIIIGPT